MQTDPLGLQIEGVKLSAQQTALYPAGTAPAAFSSSELSLYRYCHNDPVNHSDPTGLYVTYGDKWTDKDAENFQKIFEREWSSPQGRAAWEAMYASEKEFRVVPDRAAGTSAGGAAGFNILTSASGFQSFLSSVKDAVSNALGGVQGRGNFEKGREGDNTAANREAKAIADQAGLSQGQREIFHREISKQGYNKTQLLEEAQRIKSTYPNK